VVEREEAAAGRYPEIQATQGCPGNYSALSEVTEAALADQDRMDSTGAACRELHRPAYCQVLAR
jgi:hypothetical protein